jgi:hypothetical protein
MWYNIYIYIYNIRRQRVNMSERTGRDKKVFSVKTMIPNDRNAIGSHHSLPNGSQTSPKFTHKISKFYHISLQ